MARRPFLHPLLPTAVALTMAGGATAASTCDNKQYNYPSTYIGEIAIGSYWLINDMWGRGSAPSGSWECIWSNSLTSWGTSFNWGNQNIYNVKSFPALVKGWAWQPMPSGSGMGFQVWEKNNVMLTWSWDYSNVPSAPSHNASIDCWFHSGNANPQGNNYPTLEVIIMPYRNPISLSGSGSNLGNVTIAGNTYNVWKTTLGSGSGSWTYLQYLRTSNTKSVSNLNLRTIWDDAIWRSVNNWNLNVTSIQTGWETFTGNTGSNGSLSTNNYAISIY